MHHTPNTFVFSFFFFIGKQTKTSMANGSSPNKNKELHIVMFPWLAFGHILPFYHLSKSLILNGHRITFISTPRNIDRLPNLPQQFASSMTLLKLQLPNIEGLPQDAEATMDIKAEDMDLLKRAFDGMEAGVTEFLHNSGADVIIYDFPAHWVPPIADALGISRYLFCIISAWFLAFFGHTEALITGLPDRPELEDFLIPPKWAPAGSKLAYNRHEAQWVRGAARTNASGCSDMYRVGKCIVGSDAIIIRHCYEFEPIWLSLLGELHQKEVIPLGLMPPRIQETSDDIDSWAYIKSWLCGKTEGSVVYIALGSEVQLSGEEMRELAHGLELSGAPFLWALRKPPVVEDGEEDLPRGFEMRTRGRGIVWRNWAPQLEILGHGSVGAFLTHSGWSSIVEGLMFGVPLVLLPFVVDQGLNARVLADNMAGVEVPRNETSGMYTRDGVAESVRMVIGDEEIGHKLRGRARELSAVLFGDGEIHERYVEGFLECLEKHVR